MTVVANRVTVVAQCAKALDIHGYVAGSIPAVILRYCTISTINALRSTKKKIKINITPTPDSYVCTVLLYNVPW